MSPLLGALLAAGCAGPARTDGDLVREKLARVGLEPESEAEALVPPAERGRYLPCRVIPGFRGPVLREDPAGYLIVGINRRPAPGAEAIRRALAEWDPGETLEVTVRRNPYRQAQPEWWEADVPLRVR